jgi:Cd2+/Zn2+-exporting ATPase
VPLNGAGPADILALAAALEARSEHPIGQAIMDRASADGLSFALAERVQSLPGRGAQGMIGNATVVVGSRRLFEERGLSSPEVGVVVDELARQGRSTVIVACDGQVAGVIGVADEIREAARDVVEMLGTQGVDRVVMLTGDHEMAARALASSVGISEYRAELLPEHKMDAVTELRSRHGALAMVGDGVNDAPALAAADVGIAMGVAGTDAALETADVALMADELAKIPFALRLSRATARNIRVNIAVSLGLKAAFLVMALAGAATLWMAVVADMGASLIVIANALRLLRE